VVILFRFLLTQWHLFNAQWHLFNDYASGNMKWKWFFVLWLIFSGCLLSERTLSEGVCFLVLTCDAQRIERMVRRRSYWRYKSTQSAARKIIRWRRYSWSRTGNGNWWRDYFKFFTNVIELKRCCSSLVRLQLQSLKQNISCLSRPAFSFQVI